MSERWTRGVPTGYEPGDTLRVVALTEEPSGVITSEVEAYTPEDSEKRALRADLESAQARTLALLDALGRASDGVRLLYLNDKLRQEVRRAIGTLQKVEAENEHAGFPAGRLQAWWRRWSGR